jgi:hypothetical protein
MRLRTITFMVACSVHVFYTDALRRPARLPEIRHAMPNTPDLILAA